MHNAELLDTSFFLRFLNDDSPLFNNADGYFRYFLQKEIKMYIVVCFLSSLLRIYEKNKVIYIHIYI